MSKHLFSNRDALSVVCDYAMLEHEIKIFGVNQKVHDSIFEMFTVQ